MANKNRQELIENSRVIEADPRLHRERDGDGFPQRAQDLVDAIAIAEQPAAGALAIHDRHRAAEVQIDRRDRMLLELARGADQSSDIIANHLCYDWAAGRVLGDGSEDLRIEPRFGKDPEVFGEIDVDRKSVV